METVETRRQQYDASSIAILKGLEAVRRRPAMYIGALGQAGVHHLCFEIVQNSVDEAMAGHCSQIDVVLHEDGSCEVSDDGRGIPIEMHPEAARPASEIVLTTLHAGSKFGHGVYAMAGGLHGVGLSCVNALAEWLVIEVMRDGGHHRQRFARGVPVGDLAKVGSSLRSGTAIRFLPDTSIMGAGVEFDATVIARRLKEHAFLWPGLTIRFQNRRTGGSEEYRYDTGIVGFVEDLNRSRKLLHPQPIHVAGESGGIRIEAALQWTAVYVEDVATYANGVSTPRGGTHLEGLRSALTRVVTRYATEHGLVSETNEKIAGFDVREGLTCVLSLMMPDPEFEGQSKSSLSSAGALGAVEKVITSGLLEHFSAHPGVAGLVVGRAVEASRARAAARRAAERARYRSADTVISKEVYKQQFGIRSKNWHDSARWITDDGLLQTHARSCAVDERARVLDVCCGSGVVGAAFKGRVGSVTGLDITPEMVALARTRLDEVLQGDVYKMPFDSSSFDLVVNREVLHLLPEPNAPLAEIFRVLRPGGQFLVGQLVPFGDADSAWMFRLLKKKQPLFFNNFTRESFQALLEETGFGRVEVTEYLQWEDIDVWIDTHETPSLNRHEIRDLYYNAPAEVKAAHPFEVSPSGRIRDCWRWCVFSAFKPESRPSGNGSEKP
jgi:DNA gyrase subunit B